MKAIKAVNVDTWPMINVANVSKHFPESNETQKGHMRQTKQVVRSTKVSEVVEENSPIPPDPKQRDVMVKIVELRELISMDQIGKFPVTSSRGTKYIMVLFEIDGNLILVAPMKNLTEGEMIKEY